MHVGVSSDSVLLAVRSAARSEAHAVYVGTVRTVTPRHCSSLYCMAPAPMPCDASHSPNVSRRRGGTNHGWRHVQRPRPRMECTAAAVVRWYSTGARRSIPVLLCTVRPGDTGGSAALRRISAACPEVQTAYGVRAGHRAPAGHDCRPNPLFSCLSPLAPSQHARIDSI